MVDTSRFGILTPILTRNVDRQSWEHRGSVQDLAAIVQAADRLGYHYITCSEHVGIPHEAEAYRGARYYDPLATFGYLAALTLRIRFATYVLVLGYHHPLEIAKRYGTLDVMSGGRVILGLGVGTLRPEFELLGLGGAAFEQRGERADDALRAIRAIWGRREPAYSGKHYRFQGFIIDPCAVREDVVLWIGGRTLRSLRRAAELGDGWAPFGLSVEEMGTMLRAAREWPSWQTRKTPLECILRHDDLLDPIGAPERTAERIRQTFAAGATKVNLGFTHKSPAHYIEQLEALAALRTE